METKFEEEADAAASPVKQISAALVEAGQAGQGAAMTPLRQDR
jgi:hypothetical protein